MRPGRRNDEGDADGAETCARGRDQPDLRPIDTHANGLLATGWDAVETARRLERERVIARVQVDRLGQRTAALDECGLRAIGRWGCFPGAAIALDAGARVEGPADSSPAGTILKAVAQRRRFEARIRQRSRDQSEGKTLIRAAGRIRSCERERIDARRPRCRYTRQGGRAISVIRESDSCRQGATDTERRSR